MEKKTRDYGIIAVAIISVALIVGSGFVFDNSEKTRFTVETTSDGNMNVIQYWGDYDYDKYLETGSKNLDSLYSFLSDNVTGGKKINGIYPVNCSTFVTLKDDGSGYYAGRNFDFRYSTPTLVYTDGPNQYASVTTVDGRMFGNTDEPLNEIKKDPRFNAVPYLPMDGLNEKGVYVCINSINGTGGFIQTDEGKSTIFITSSIRLIMDYADSTEMAVWLLKQYNIFSDVGYHLLICDNTGDSRSVEFIGENMYVNETKIMTNHYIAKEGKDVEVKPSSAERFAKLQHAIAENPQMSRMEVRNTMKSVMQNDPDLEHYTRWSIVYDMEDLDATICIRTGENIDWDSPYFYDVRYHGEIMNVAVNVEMIAIMKVSA